MKLSYLVRGFPGHPAHPPMTDGAIGAYAAATVLVCLAAVGVAEEALARAWWIVLLVGLGFGALAALTGLVDWLTITRRTPLWRTATLHMLVMLAATALFALAAVLGYDGYRNAEVDALPLALTLAGFAVLALGGWIGGSIVYVHGMRVLDLVSEPTGRATTPGHPEKAEREAA